jgi:transcription antitermination factor NusG
MIFTLTSAVEPRRSPPEPWYTIRTKSRHEKVVAKQLEMDGLEFYLPTTRQSRYWSDRRKITDFPLFPGYVFVRLPHFASEKIQILRKAGVLGFVGGERGAASIPDHELSSVRLLAEKGIPCASHPYLKVGQRIRVSDGVLRGLEGILVRVGSKDGLVLSIDLIQRSLLVQLQGYSVQVV